MFRRDLARLSRQPEEGRGRSLGCQLRINSTMMPSDPVSWLSALEADLPAVAAWYAVWTRSHCEQLVGDQLAARGFQLFLPKATVWSRRGGKRRQIPVPLFPGYLFVHHALDKRSHTEIVKARGVVKVLGDGWRRPAAIGDDVIDAIRRLEGAGAPVFPHRHLREGDRVRIIGGPLEGLEGFFVRGRSDKGLLVLSVELLQRSVAVEVDCTLVEAA
jgi:transcription termination/antitermination protein NusG